MQVGDSRAHRNSSGSGNYEGNGAISEVMGLALHTGLAPALLCCTITILNTLYFFFYLPLVFWIPGPCILDLTLLSCVAQLLNTLNCILYWTLLSSLILYTSFTTIAPLLVLPLTLQFRALHTGFKVCFLKELLFSTCYTNHYFLPLSQISSTNTTIL